MAEYMANQSSRFKPNGSPTYVCLKKNEDSLFIKTHCPVAMIKGMDPTAEWNKDWSYRFNNSIPDGNYFVWNSLGRLLEHRVIRNNKQNGLMFHSYSTDEISATINLYEDGTIIKTGEIFKGQINGKIIGIDSLNSFEEDVYEYYMNLLNTHYFEYAKLQD